MLILALLAALGGGLLWYQHEQRLAQSVWPDATPDMLQSIELVSRKERFLLLREPAGWVVRQEDAGQDAPPVPADMAKIEALLTAIAHNRPGQMLDQASGVEPSALGFEDPTLRIVLTPAGAGVAPVQLTFGKETPTGAAIYVHSSMAQSTVFLMDASVLHQLDKPATHYFDARLIDVRGEDVQRLTLMGSQGVQWDLERKDDQFLFNVPATMQGAPVTSSEVRLFVHNLTALMADTILVTPERQASGKAVITIELLQPKAPAQKIELFPPLDAEQVFGRSTRHPAGFLLEREKARQLVRQAYDMQWRGVVSFDSSRVEAARIYSVMHNQTLVVEKSAAGWEEAGNARRIPGIDMTLWRLKELRFEAEPVSRLGYPAAQKLVLDLMQKDGKVLSSYTFFSDPRLPADQCWLKVGSEEMYYPVTSQLLEDMQSYLPARPASASHQAQPGQPVAAGQAVQTGAAAQRPAAADPRAQ